MRKTRLVLVLSGEAQGDARLFGLDPDVEGFQTPHPPRRGLDLLRSATGMERRDREDRPEGGHGGSVGIRERAGAQSLPDDMLTVERHIRCARGAAEAIGRAVQAIERGEPLDIASVDLWEARRLLGEITGEDATETVIDAVFSHFCVGK